MMAFMHIPSETKDQAVLRFLLRTGLRVLFRGLIRPPVPLALQRAVLRLLTCGLPPARGVSLERATLAGLPCEWHRPAKTTTVTAGVILYLHGGGFVLGGANTHRALASHLAHQTHMAVVAIDYRRSPEHPFPAARDDALCAYQALLDGGYSPRQIVIAGDSAGGNLCLITGLRLRELGLPQPAAYVCFSPVTDFTGTHLHAPLAGDPLIHPAWLAQALALYVPTGFARDDPGLSPVLADCRGLAPLLIQVGEDEVLLNDSLRMAQQAQADGVDVVLQRFPDLWHVFQAQAGVLRVSDRALADVAVFLQPRVRAWPKAQASSAAN
jgi:monoterpene epsilon-lactone hydrolase